MMQLRTDMGARVHCHPFMPLPGTAFAGKPPGYLPLHLRKVINKLAAAGKAFGNWRRQEKQAGNLVHRYEQK